MNYNYFISYDLIAPGQRYDLVIEAIQQTGAWAKLEKSLYYVRSNLQLKAITDHVRGAMDPNDKLVVIDATSNAALTFNIDPVAFQQREKNWYA